MAKLAAVTNRITNTTSHEINVAREFCEALVMGGIEPPNSLLQQPASKRRGTGENQGGAQLPDVRICHRESEGGISAGGTCKGSIPAANLPFLWGEGQENGLSSGRDVGSKPEARSR